MNARTATSVTLALALSLGGHREVPTAADALTLPLLLASRTMFPTSSSSIPLRRPQAAAAARRSPQRQSIHRSESPPGKRRLSSASTSVNGWDDEDGDGSKTRRAAPQSGGFAAASFLSVLSSRGRASPKHGTMLAMTSSSASTPSSALGSGEGSRNSTSSGLGSNPSSPAPTPTAYDPQTETTALRRENARLRSLVKSLQAENESLQSRATRAAQHSSANGGNKIVIETFEGEHLLHRKGDEDVWFDHVGDEEEAGWWSPPNQKSKGGGITMTEPEMETTSAKQLKVSSVPSPQEPNGELWCDELEDGTCPTEPDVSFRDALRDRAYWLVGLLALQSCSGFILARNEELLQTHPVIVYFLTMLVGAGGNAGNQASVRVIRGLALGTLNERTQRQFLNRELKMAFSLSSILSLAGFFRATVFRTPVAETIAVTAALALIVFSSICLGSVLPLILKKFGIDPAHSSTSIQVIMDILGVVLTVIVSTCVLDSALGQLLISRLSPG